MRLVEARYLVDLNVLIALTDEEHQHHSIARRWFESGGQNWGTCALTQAGFIRVMVNAKARGYAVDEATYLLSLLTQHPGHRFWPITDGWTMTSLFADRIFGHQQVTDAYLLGLAIQADGILVTLDKTIR